MKILGLSLGRSGTYSLNCFLNQNGIQSTHGYDFKNIKKGSFTEDLDGINSYMKSVMHLSDAFTDIPYCFGFEYFKEIYPNAKFIYIKRDLESWSESMININNVWSYHGDPYIFEELYCNIYTSTGKNKIQDLTKSELKEIWLEHDKKINEKLGGNPNLLEVSLNDPKIAQKIGSFLNLEKHTEFPWTNTIQSIYNKI